MFDLHSLQGHASGFHELINFSDSLKELQHLINIFLCFLSYIDYYMILDYTKDFEIRKYLLLSLKLFHFQLYRFLSPALAIFCGALLQNRLAQEVQKSSNYCDKLF